MKDIFLKKTLTKTVPSAKWRYQAHAFGVLIFAGRKLSVQWRDVWTWGFFPGRRPLQHLLLLRQRRSWLHLQSLRESTRTRQQFCLWGHEKLSLKLFGTRKDFSLVLRKKSSHNKTFQRSDNKRKPEPPAKLSWFSWFFFSFHWDKAILELSSFMFSRPYFFSRAVSTTVNSTTMEKPSRRMTGATRVSATTAGWPVRWWCARSSATTKACTTRSASPSWTNATTASACEFGNFSCRRMIFRQGNLQVY